MPNTREKLIELLREVQYLGGLEEKIADHLIAHGVRLESEQVTSDKASDCVNKVMTNADRIRAMSDEELAKHFLGIICDINEGVEYHADLSRWLEWLKQPAEESVK